MIKKLIFKMIIIPAFLFGGFGYYMYASTGKIPFMGEGGFSSSSSGGQSTASLRKLITKQGDKPSTNTLKYFKWQDEDGQWHYGSKAPEDSQAKTVTYNPNENVISAVKIRPKTARDNVGSQSGQTSSSAITGEASDAYSPEKIKRTMSDAKNMQKTLDDRFKKQEEMLKSIR